MGQAEEEEPWGRLKRNNTSEEKQGSSVSWKPKIWRLQEGKTREEAQWRLLVTSESHLHTVLGWCHVDRVQIIVGYWKRTDSGRTEHLRIRASKEWDSKVVQGRGGSKGYGKHERLCRLKKEMHCWAHPVPPTFLMQEIKIRKENKRRWLVGCWTPEYEEIDVSGRNGEWETAYINSSLRKQINYKIELPDYELNTESVRIF